MAQKRKAAPRFTTDKGVAIYPHLVTADTEFDAGGVYHSKLKVPLDAKIYDEKRKALGTLVEVIDQRIEEAVEQFTAAGKTGKKDKKTGEVAPIEPADPPYEVSNGELVFKVKLNASGKNSSTGEEFIQKPIFYDAKGNRFVPDRLWNGSVLKPGFEIVPYYNAKDGIAGVTLRLKAVQVIKLVSSGSGPGADAFGFGEEEGFESEDDGETGSEFDDTASYEEDAARQASQTDATDF